MDHYNHNGNDQELNHLFWKDEILQVMYWMYGEDLEREVPLGKLTVLLNSTRVKLVVHLDDLVKEGFLLCTRNEDICYSLTDLGRKEAGQRFAGAFEGMQKVGHGECGPDCDCQWEGHDSCQHHLHQH